VWEKGRHLIGNAAQLEMAREQGKAHEQQEQVREDHPFVLEMKSKAGEARASLEAREGELVGDDDRQPRERDRERVAVEQCHAEKRKTEQDEIDWNSQEGHDRGSLRAWPCWPAADELVARVERQAKPRGR